MDIKGIGYGMLVGAIVISVASVLYLKKRNMLHEKALIYGLLANIMVQLFAFLFIYTGDFLAVLMNAVFLALITYNTITIFGTRMSKIYEKDMRALLSFFTGNAVLANALSFILIGLASLSFDSIASNEGLIASVGVDTMNQLAAAMKSVTMDHLDSMLVGTLASMIVTYSALIIFARAHQTKVASMNIKGIFILFSFYVINLYIPNTTSQEWMQMVLYGAIAISSHVLMKQVWNEKTTERQ